MEIEHPSHCYFLANGVCTHNSHAVAYMLTAYRQLYMLAHHPTEYFASLLAQTPRGKKERGEERMTLFMRAAMARGIKVLSPDVVAGPEDFDVVGDSVAFGLSKVKGVASAAAAVVRARPFESLEELVDKVDRRKANARVLSSLIMAGAMDELSYDPAAGPELIPPYEDVERRNGLLLRLRQLRKTKAEVKTYLPMTLREKERELLGIAFSWWASSTKDELRERLNLRTISRCLEKESRRLPLLAEVTSVRLHKSVRGTMAFLTLADETGTLDNVVVWAEQWTHYRDKLKAGRVSVIKLKRRENEDTKYGKFSYYLDDREKTPPVEAALQAMRRRG